MLLLQINIHTNKRARGFLIELSKVAATRSVLPTNGRKTVSAPPKRAETSLLSYKEFYVLAAVKAAVDSRGAFTPANVHRTFSVRLNRFTGTMHADLRCNMVEECRRKKREP